jgi:hypothetical protein
VAQESAVFMNARLPIYSSEGGKKSAFTIGEGLGRLKEIVASLVPLKRLQRQSIEVTMEMKP